jgi:hypothetical protein
MVKKIPISDKDREEIKTMAGLGMRYEDIAYVKKWSLKTLERHCAFELRSGRITGKLTIQKTAFEMAKCGKFPALTIFWLKRNCKWYDRPFPGVDLSTKVAAETPIKTGSVDPVEAAKIYQKIMAD